MTYLANIAIIGTGLMPIVSGIFIWGFIVNLSKELFVISRSFHSVLLPAAIVILTGYSNAWYLISVAALMFLGSFLFQYLVLHFALKQIEELVWRRSLLTSWNVVAQCAFLVSGLFLLDIYSKQQSDAAADFQLWTIVYIIGGAAAIGSKMTRLAFERYQSL